ncbi:type II secretion system F family protein [Paenibacillus contaminans]|uniref:Type II secretion system protein n=1 Tax=Paenibacillus contaminans TaxID=450362 RepID=A0A329MLB3_9BACL|nr:type II secretion system F family protein [Paenibacillus contaminans]RAV20595.1 type II secretion system protein [Paenibacillus contaminans]
MRQTNNPAMKRPLLESLDELVLRQLDRRGYLNKCPQLSAKIHVRMTMLYGGKEADARTRLFISKTIVRTFLVFIFLHMLALISGDPLGFVLGGFCFSGFVPFHAYMNLEKQIKQRRVRIILDLPEYVDKLLLLVQAGETVQQAMLRCISNEKADAGHPLYKELRQLVNELSNNRSFPQAMEDMARRAAVQEVSMFSSAMLLNMRRGGDELIYALRELSRMLWEKRLSTAKTLGEEASSKMVFPMVVIFGVVVIVVAAPAILFMNQQ